MRSHDSWFSGGARRQPGRETGYQDAELAVFTRLIRRKLKRWERRMKEVRSTR